MEGPIRFKEADDRWVLLGRWRYGEDYYVHPDSEVYSDVMRSQWMYPGGLIATIDYYVRKGNVYGGPDPAQADLGQWEVVERVHFYDPDESWQQLVHKTFQHAVYPATDDNLKTAKSRCIALLRSRDSGHLSEWWALWREE